jgi:HEAT repeat protein
MNMKRQDVMAKRSQWVLILLVVGLLLVAAPARAQQLVDQLPEGAHHVVASPADSAVSYAAVGRTLYRSHDSGRTWTETATLPSAVTTLLPANRDAALIYAGTQAGGVLRSFDGGATWQAINDSLGMTPGAVLEVSALALDPADDAIIYAATGYWLGSTRLHFSPNAILFSTSGGANWLPLAALPLSAQRITTLVALPQNPLTVEATTVAGQVQTYAVDPAVLAELTTAPAAPASQRAAAAQALGMSKDAAAVPALLEALRSGDVLLVTHAATALGVLRAGEAAPVLAQMLAEDGILAPAAVANALADIGTPEALDALLAALDSAAMTPARHAAMAALERLGNPTVPGLLAVVANGAPAAQRNAAEMLGWIGDRSAVDGLLAALSAGDDQVRAQAAWALGEIGDPAAWPALAAAAQGDASAEVRLYATGALSRLPEPPTVTVAPAPGVLDPADAAPPATTTSAPPLPGWLTKAMPVVRYVILAVVLILAALLPWYQGVRAQRKRRHN